MFAPKKQHYIPQCYLREFVDPKTPAGHEPYVWIFSKNGKKKEKRAPKNTFYQTDLYTLEIQGLKHYAIETSLAQLEGQYAEIVRHKIRKYLSLAEQEHVVLCAFVAAMMQRTLRSKENFESFLDQVIEKVEAMEKLHGLAPEKSADLREAKKDSHRLGVIQLLPDLTQLLFNMSLAFLCSDGTGSRFITSDDPVTLFNPDLQWQRFYGPGLAQGHIQVTMPISPEITACMTWSDLRGYIHIPRSRVEDLNRMTRAHCYKSFVSNSPRTRWVWFSRVPVHDPWFLLTVARHLVAEKIRQIRLNHRYRRAGHR